MPRQRHRGIIVADERFSRYKSRLLNRDNTLRSIREIPTLANSGVLGKCAFQ